MLQGIFPVIPTLFSDDDSLDLEAQRKVVRFAIDSGAHGVVFPGVASEYDYLSSDERAQLIPLVAMEADGKVPIVGGASAQDPEKVIEAGRQAEACGIQHLMVLAPSNLGTDLEAHREFFSVISAALPDAGIILQNAPEPIGAGLDSAAIASLAAENPSITCIKEETIPSGPAITMLRNAEIPHLETVFGGGGSRYLIDELDRGALGAMPAAELTDLHVSLWNAYQSGDHRLARHLYRLSLPLLVTQAIYRMRLTKYVLSKRGIAEALHVRAPLPELDAYTKRDIDRMVADLADELES